MIEVRYKNEHKVDTESELFKKLLHDHQRLLTKDRTIWGSEAASEAALRLDWIDLPTQSRTMLTQLDSLAAKYRHLRKVILCGMGGSSLGPEVIARTFGKEIFILDSTDPNYISHALHGELENTLVIIGSKSGSTIETASHKAFFEKQFEEKGLNKFEHMLVVTDPDSPLDVSSRASGFTVVNANPNVGGRFSVLGAFGLIPAAIIGIDVSVLLDSALDTRNQLTSEPYPALLAAFAFISETNQYFSITDDSSLMPGLSDWIEQLIAESTGKKGAGLLPVVLEHADDFTSENCLSVSFLGDSDLVVSGDLGSQFFFWEWTAALIGAGLSIDPFNQPNVQESKLASGLLLEQWGNSLPLLGDRGIDGSIAYFEKTENVTELVSAFVQGISHDGYLAVMAYMDRKDDVAIRELRNIIAEKIGKPVTFGWGPRFLHSTGQFHKGGQPNGSFLQITAESDLDIAIPDKDFSFNTLCLAQAIGDQKALMNRNMPTLRLHLMNRKAGIAQLLEIARTL